MDCIRQISSERQSLDDRKVSPAFHLAVIEEALRFLADELASPGACRLHAETGELRAACVDALEALAELRTATP